jgi:hypothetical protein
MASSNWRPAARQRFLVNHCGDVLTDFDACASDCSMSTWQGDRDVCNLGYAEWIIVKDTVSIRLRPSLTTASTCDRIRYWLNTNARIRVHISYWSTGAWHHEICGSGPSAADRVDELVSRHGGGAPGNVRRNPKADHDIVRTPQFRAVLDYWKGYRTTFSPERDVPHAQRLMGGRATLIRVDYFRDLKLISEGSNLTAGAKDWVKRNPAAPLSLIPFYHYSKALFDAYEEADQSFSPVSDEIDGLFTWPSRRRFRLSYHRLILPFREGDSRWLLVSSIPDDSIEALP